MTGQMICTTRLNIHLLIFPRSPIIDGVESYPYVTSVCMGIHIAGKITEGVSEDNVDMVDAGEEIKHEKEDFILALSVVSGKHFASIVSERVLRYIYKCMLLH